MNLPGYFNYSIFSAIVNDHIDNIESNKLSENYIL